MIWLSGSVRRELVGRPGVGLMMTPRMRQAPLAGLPWATDVGIWRPGEFSMQRYVGFLERNRGHWPRLLFATVPDVWADAKATRAGFAAAADVLAPLGVPLAYVAQPYTVPADVPWSSIRTLFIGGPDAWQWSLDVERLVVEAHERGVWLHRGRASGWPRVSQSHAQGFDSTDGTVLRHDPQRLGRILNNLAAINSQLPMWGDE